MSDTKSEVLFSAGGIGIMEAYTRVASKRSNEVILHRAVATILLGRKRIAWWPYAVVLAGIVVPFFDEEWTLWVGIGVMLIGGLLAFLLFPRYSLTVKLVNGDSYALLRGKRKLCGEAYAILCSCCGAL